MMTVYPFKKQILIASVSLSFFMPSSISIGMEGEGNRDSKNSKSTRSISISSDTGSPRLLMVIPTEEGEKPLGEIENTKQKMKTHPNLTLDLNKLKKQQPLAPGSFPGKKSTRSVSVPGPQKSPSDRAASSPRLSSPHSTLTPRSRSFSVSDGTHNSGFTEIIINLTNRCTPRKNRINEDIGAKFEEMGVPIFAENLNYLSLLRREFYLKVTMNENEPWLPKEDEWTQIHDISLDAFWGNYPVTTDLVDNNYKAKISDSNLGLIAASGVFLIKKVGSESKPVIKALSKSMRDCYLELSKREPDNWEHRYHIAECLTKMASYEEAWPYLFECIPYLKLDDVDLAWITKLKDHILEKVKEETSNYLKARRYFEIAELIRKIDTIEGRDQEDNSELNSSGSFEESCQSEIDDIDLYLKSVGYLYRNIPNNSFAAMNIPWGPQAWHPDVLFFVACRAYDYALKKEDEQVAHRLLTISCDFFRRLTGCEKMSDYNYGDIINEPLKSLQPKDSVPIRSLKAFIFIHIGNAIWEAQQDESKRLYRKASEMLYPLISRLEYGAEAPVDGDDFDATTFDQDGKTIFHYALERQYSLDLLQILLQETPKKAIFQALQHKDNQLMTPLDYAMVKNKIDHFVKLLNGYPDCCNPPFALKFYKNQVLVKPDYVALKDAFIALMMQNREVEWWVSLLHMLPTTSGIEGVKALSINNSYIKIPPSIWNEIFDKEGVFIPCNKHGNRKIAVASITPDSSPLCLTPHHLYFKLYPTFPGIEEAAGRLTRTIFGCGAPYTDLIVVDNSPIMVSQGIAGKNFADVLQNNPDLINQLDAKNVSSIILMAMLTNPEDGKPENYIVEPSLHHEGQYNLVCINNDQNFVPSDRVKTILYCLNQMHDPVHSEVVDRLLKINSYDLLEEWLKGLDQLNGSYGWDRIKPGALPLSKQAAFLKERSTFIGVVFPKGTITRLYQKLKTVQQCLKINPEIQHIQLLYQLEPYLAQIYGPALENGSSILDRFNSINAAFYQNNGNGFYTTLTNTQDILLCFVPTLNKDIFNTEDLEEVQKALEEIKRTHGTRSALDELYTCNGFVGGVCDKLT